jgi:hypothetical protein
MLGYDKTADQQKFGTYCCRLSLPTIYILANLALKIKNLNFFSVKRVSSAFEKPKKTSQQMTAHPQLKTGTP